MLELGELTREMHQAALCDVSAVHPEQFIAVGREFIAAIESLPEHGGLRASANVARDSIEAGTLLRGIVQPGDVLLVKGSRGIEMERAIASLLTA
jgi:UDP-N-acetylmuramyl pentapeptide synthase